MTGLILNFHGIGKPRRPFEHGEEPYWVSETKFSAVLDLVEASKMEIGLTFDDGNETDWLIAVPQLKKRSLSAQFFVIAGLLNEFGYLSEDQVAQIDSNRLFTIGSHGLYHRPWTDITVSELNKELQESQKLLSKICNRPITQAGLPFGKYDRTVLRQATEFGYERIYSSDGAPRYRGANPVPRFSLRSDTSLAFVDKLIRKYESFASRIGSELRATIKSLR